MKAIQENFNTQTIREVISLRNSIESEYIRLKIDIDDFCNYVGISRKTLYNRFENPNNWKLEQLLKAYQYIASID